jgi:hypothetical protein
MRAVPVLTIHDGLLSSFVTNTRRFAAANYRAKVYQ